MYIRVYERIIGTETPNMDRYYFLSVQKFQIWTDNLFYRSIFLHPNYTLRLLLLGIRHIDITRSIR